MRILRAFLFSSVMVATGYPALLLGSTGSAQVSLPYFYYENFFVGQTPTSGEDIGMVSAEENVAASTFSGIFADFTSGSGDVGVTNTAAALDACVGEMIPNRFRPTGHLAVARHYGGANPPTIDFYATMSWDPQWRYNQNLPITQAPTWSIPTITGNPVLAMDVANGIADTGVGQMNLTEYLITVESFGGNLYLASYALSDISGNPVQPFFVSYAPTTLTGSCLGMVVSNGNRSLGPIDRTRNEIVFVRNDPPPVASNLWVHSIKFDIRTALFGILDDPTNNYVTPLDIYPIANNVMISGIWIAQNDRLALDHRVGISVPNQNPGAPGTLVVFTPTRAMVPHTGTGGGPLCHVPFGSRAGSSTYYSPAWHLFPGLPHPSGWYVVTPGPGLPGSPYHIKAIDIYGGVNNGFVFSYPPNSVPNGTPLSHPAAIGKEMNNSYRKGALWVPYVDQSTAPFTYYIELAEGISIQGYPMHPYGRVQHQVAAANFPNLANPLPKAGMAWPVTTLLSDQKINFKSEYGLYLPGY